MKQPMRALAVVAGLVLLSVGLWGYWIGQPGCGYFIDSTEKSQAVMAARGAWGDTFTPITAVLNAFALFAVIYSVLLQQRELTTAVKALTAQKNLQILTNRIAGANGRFDSLRLLLEIDREASAICANGPPNGNHPPAVAAGMWHAILEFEGACRKAKLAEDAVAERDNAHKLQLAAEATGQPEVIRRLLTARSAVRDTADRVDEIGVELDKQARG